MTDPANVRRETPAAEFAGQVQVWWCCHLSWGSLHGNLRLLCSYSTLCKFFCLNSTLHPYKNVLINPDFNITHEPEKFLCKTSSGKRMIIFAIFNLICSSHSSAKCSAWRGLKQKRSLICIGMLSVVSIHGCGRTRPEYRIKSCCKLCITCCKQDQLQNVSQPSENEPGTKCGQFRVLFAVNPENNRHGGEAAGIVVVG